MGSSPIGGNVDRKENKIEVVQIRIISNVHSFSNNFASQINKNKRDSDVVRSNNAAVYPTDRNRFLPRHQVSLYHHVPGICVDNRFTTPSPTSISLRGWRNWGIMSDMNQKVCWQSLTIRCGWLIDRCRAI